MANLLTYLLIFCGAAASILVVLVIYGNTLDTRENEQIHVNKQEQTILAGEQPALISRMNRLARVIVVLAVITGVSLLASASVWVWIGLYRS